MATISKFAYFEDKIVPYAEARLNVASSAVLYGLSVYTVFPVVQTNKEPTAFRLRDHYARLANSAKIIGITTFEPAWTYERFEEAVRALVRANAPTADIFVRATVHVSELVPGTRARGLATTFSMFAYEAQAIVPQDGARLKTSVWHRVPDYAIPSRAKVNGAYVNSVLARQDAIDAGYDDCIFLDAAGHVCELSAANIFMVRGGVLVTPDTASDILEGITRRTVLELARGLGIHPVARRIDLTELYVADELFASGTSSIVAFVKEVDGRVIGNGTMGPVTSRIREAYLGILSGEDPRASEYLTVVQ